MMMLQKPKKAVSFMLDALTKPREMEHPEMDSVGADSASESALARRSAASAILQAIKHDDAELLAYALKDFIECCEEECEEW